MFKIPFLTNKKTQIVQDEPSIEEETVADCPIFYQMHNRSCMETCMCWGWEFNHGWDEIVQKMSRQIEFLNNLYYPKYRVRIQADQIKEKFGTLHFYWSIHIDKPRFVKWVGLTCGKIEKFLNKKINYKLTRVVDKPEWEETTKRESTEEERQKFLSLKWETDKIVFTEENGKIYRTSKICHMAVSHNEPTKHKLLWKLKKFLRKQYTMLACSGANKTTPEQRNAYEAMMEMATQIEINAEKQCSKTCERCGRTIGTDYSQTCATCGWITYICEDCAKKSKEQYWDSDGNLCFNGKIIKTKEELEKRREETEKDVSDNDSEHQD